MSNLGGLGNGPDDQDDQGPGNPGSPGGDGSQPGSDANSSPGVNNLFEGNNSLFSAQQPFPTTLALQGELFILRHDFLDEEMAIEFYEQAMRYPHLKINDSRNIQKKNPQNVDVQKNSTQVLPGGFEDFWNLGNETSDSEVLFRGSWVLRRNVDV